MLKSLVRLEAQVLEKVYHFVCDPDSPISDVKIALDHIQKMVEAIEENAIKERAAQAQKESSQEEEKVVEIA